MAEKIICKFVQCSPFREWKVLFIDSLGFLCKFFTNKNVNSWVHDRLKAKWRKQKRCETKAKRTALVRHWYPSGLLSFRFGGVIESCVFALTLEWMLRIDNDWCLSIDHPHPLLPLLHPPAPNFIEPTPNNRCQLNHCETVWQHRTHPANHTHTHQDRFLSIAFITAAIYMWNEEDNESIRNKKPKIYANPNKCDIIFRSVVGSERIRIQSRWDFPIHFAIGAIGKYLTFHNSSHNCRTESRSFILLSIPLLDLQICLRFKSAEVLHFFFCFVCFQVSMMEDGGTAARIKQEIDSCCSPSPTSSNNNVSILSFGSSGQEPVRLLVGI